MKLKLYKGGKGLTGREWEDAMAAQDSDYSDKLQKHRELTFTASVNGCPDCQTLGLCDKHIDMYFELKERVK